MVLIKILIFTFKCKRLLIKPKTITKSILVSKLGAKL